MIKNEAHFVLEHPIYFLTRDVELNGKLDYHVDIGHKPLHYVMLGS